MAQAKEAVSINIRAKARQRDLIDQAADRLGRSRSKRRLPGKNGRATIDAAQTDHRGPCGAMPDPLPVLLLGRLAIDRRYHNQGLGKALLRDAMLRAVSVAADAGVFAIILHALSEQAKRFYLSCGFVESPLQPMTLMMTLETARAILAESD